MTIDLHDEFFIHSILFVQDVLGGFWGSATDDDRAKYRLTQIEVYVGNDTDWRNNPKCTLTPHFTAEGREYTYGFVEWCNMPGQYVTFVAHGVPSDSLTICNVSINGNRYIRDLSPETTVEIPAGETRTIQVEHIRPEFT